MNTLFKWTGIVVWGTFALYMLWYYVQLALLAWYFL